MHANVVSFGFYYKHLTEDQEEKIMIFVMKFSRANEITWSEFSGDETRKIEFIMIIISSWYSNVGFGCWESLYISSSS